MAAFATETIKSRKFHVGQDGSKFTLDFIVVLAADEDAAWLAIQLVVPLVYQALPRSSYDFDPQGGGVWFATVDFDPSKRKAEDAPNKEAGKNPKNDGDPTPGEDPERLVGRQVSFSTAGGTRHITNSEDVVDLRTADGITVTDDFLQKYARVIGFSRNGITGIDIVEGAMEFTATLKIYDMTLGYFQRLHELTGTVNKSDWNGFPAGTVLFLGADGHHVDGSTEERAEETLSPGHFEINFRFKSGAIVKDKKIGNGMNPIAVILPFDLLDVHYDEKKVSMTADPKDDVMIQVPMFAVVHRVYPYEEWADLRLEDCLFDQAA